MANCIAHLKSMKIRQHIGGYGGGRGGGMVGYECGKMGLLTALNNGWHQSVVYHTYCITYSLNEYMICYFSGQLEH